MNLRVAVAVSLLLALGATLVLSALRWFARRPLDERLRPYVPGGWEQHRRSGLLSADSFREVIGPLATVVGSRVARLFGVQEDLDTRLTRIHAPIDATDVRVRQIGWAAVAFGIAAGGVGALGIGAAVGAPAVLGAPLLCFLVQEQRLARASERWQRRLFLELPTVAEQIGMLLSAGFSLGSALGRIAERGTGACAQDLGRVGRRIRQGLTDADALREWAEVAQVPAVTRLVGVLVLDRATGDLGRLIAEEARAIRREVHRELITQIDRRAQQVWIPVTVATLVPGTLFLIVPFVEAMRIFAA